MVQAGQALRGRNNLIRLTMAFILILGSIGLLTTAPARALAGTDAGVAASITDDGNGGVTVSYEIVNNAASETMAVNTLVMLYGNEVIDLAAVGCSTNFPFVPPGSTAAGCTFSLPANSPPGYTGPTACGSNLIFGGSVLGGDTEDGAKTVDDVTVQCGGPIVTPGSVPGVSDPGPGGTSNGGAGAGSAAPAAATAEGVTLEKTADQTFTSSGTIVTFTISVTNQSGGDVAITRLRDTLITPQSDQLDLLDSGSSAFEPCTDVDSGQPIDISSFPIIADGTTFVCTFTQTVTGDDGDIWTDQAEATIDFLGQNKQNVNLVTEPVDVTIGSTTTTSTTSTTLAPPVATAREENGWEITKTAERDTSLVDELVTYTVIVENHTGDPGVLVSLNEELGGVNDELLEDDPADGLDSVCTDESGSVLSGPQTIPSTGELVCVFSVLASGIEGDVLTDTVTAAIFAEDADPAVDPAVAIVADSATVTLVAEAGPLALLVDKSDGNVSVDEPGDLVVYTLTVTNLSPVAVTITEMTDAVAGNPGFSIDGLGGSNCSTGRVVQAAGSFGDSFECEFTIFVAGPSGSEVSDVVTVTAIDDNGRQISADDSESTPVLDALPSATIEVTDAGVSGAAPTSDVTFDVTITNTGREVLTMDSLLVTIGSKTGVDVTQVGGDIISTTFEPGTIIPAFSNTVYTFSYTARIDGLAGDDIATELTLSGSDDEGNLLTVSATEMTPLTGASADLALTKTADGSAVRGNEFTYTIGVSNAGADTATGVTVTDVLPAGTTFVRAQGDAWSCALASGTITCDGPPLDSGESSTFQLTLRIDSGFVGSEIVNSAQVGLDQGDPNTANNTAQATNPVVGAIVGGEQIERTPTTVVSGALPITGANSRQVAANAGLMAGVGLILWTLTSLYREHAVGLVTSLPVHGERPAPRSGPGGGVRLAARAGSLVARVSRPFRRR